MSTENTSSATPVDPLVMQQSEWFGDKSDGIELRYQGEGEDRFLDEIVVYRDGECSVHIEAMSDQCYWMSLQSKRFEVHANCFSKNGRSHVDLNAEGWSK